jgi:hypothetical protein
MMPESDVRPLGVGHPECRAVSLEQKFHAGDRKFTLLRITVVKRDFQSDGQKKHERHQRDPEPQPQGHGSPTFGEFGLLAGNACDIFCD